MQIKHGSGDAHSSSEVSYNHHQPQQQQSQEASYDADQQVDVQYVTVQPEAYSEEKGSFIYFTLPFTLIAPK